MENAVPATARTAANNAQVRNATSFLVRMGAAERTKDGDGGLVVLQSRLTQYRKADQYRNVLGNLRNSSHEPQNALVVAGALISWHEHVSTALRKYMLGIQTGDAWQSSRRMCFVRCPEISAVSGWELVTMGKLSEVCPGSWPKMRKFTEDVPCSRIVKADVVESPFHLSMWLHQAPGVKLPAGELISREWLMYL